MTRGKMIRRRALLKGLGAAGVILPFFPSLRSAFAAPTVPAKRFVLFFSANGTMPSAWKPKGTETNFQFGDILKPLDAYKKKLLILDGLGSQSIGGPGDGHQMGMGHLFTGDVLLPGQIKGGCDTCAAVSWASNASVDQAIASHLLSEAQKAGNSTKLRSLELGVQVKSSDIWARMCYRGPSLPVPPKEDPYLAFKELFAGNQDQQKLDALRIQRKSVLDSVVRDLSTLQNQLGSDDRKRLDEHLNNVRELERQLQSTGPLASCTPPQQGSPIDTRQNNNFPQIGKLQMDLLCMSLICGITPVASIQWSRSVSNVAFTWLGINSGHHDLSHKGDSDIQAVNDIIKINTWYAQQFAYLIDKLEKTPEGNGSFLDNTLVLWGNELGKGNSHTRQGIPFVLAGNAGGYFKTGRYLDYGNKPHNHLLVSLCQAMGMTNNTFGKKDFTGPLANLRA